MNVILKSFKDLMSLFARQEIPNRVIVGQDTIELTSDHEPVVIRWLSEAKLIEARMVLPVRIPDKKLPAIERLIATLNHELSIPGLTINHAERTVAYRWVVPRHLDGSFTDEELRRLIATVVSTAGNMLAHIERELELRGIDGAEMTMAPK